MSNSDANEGPVGEPHQIVIDVDDIDRSAHFWSEVLGLKVSHRWEEYLGFERHKGGLKVVLQIVPEKKTSKNRMHLDVAAEDVDAASARVEALGGMKLQEIEESGARWIVMADPDGNEFCLVRKADITALWKPKQQT
jgi:predicted enzyme related to lactoylglutathione lyase